MASSAPGRLLGELRAIGAMWIGVLQEELHSTYFRPMNSLEHSLLHLLQLSIAPAQIRRTRFAIPIPWAHRVFVLIAA